LIEKRLNFKENFMDKIKYSDHFPLKWDAVLSVESAELDRQHKELMNLFNTVLCNCSGRKSEERIFFDNIIDVFINFLVKHFRTEERLLSGKNYAGYDKHLLEHTKILEKVSFIKQEIQNGKWEMKLFILAITMKDMLLRHLNSCDISAREYFREENVSQANSIPANAAGNYFAVQG
jgi:hemerythrin-like metal-binding protein